MAIVPVGFSDEQLALFLFDYGTGKNVFARFMSIIDLLDKIISSDGTITGLEMDNKRVKVCLMNFYMRE